MDIEILSEINPTERGRKSRLRENIPIRSRTSLKIIRIISSISHDRISENRKREYKDGKKENKRSHKRYHKLKKQNTNILYFSERFAMKIPQERDKTMDKVSVLFSVEMRKQKMETKYEFVSIF